MVLLPSTTAHTPGWQIPTYAYIQAVPNPIGVNQAAYIYMWLDKVQTGSAIGNDIRFHDYQLTITAPNGEVTTETFATIEDTTSSQGFSFTPTQTGTYNLTFNFPGQNYAGTSGDYVNDTYLASRATTLLIVQEEPIASYPDSYPLPSEYWTRPIYGENPYWYTVSSNWLGNGSPKINNMFGVYSSRFLPDGVGSLTSHVMWTKPLQNGGVVGGDDFEIIGDTYFDGSAYIPRYTNPIIVNGKLYYTDPKGINSEFSMLGGASYGATNCVDLHTGKLIWSKNIPALSFALIYDLQDPQQHGVLPAILFTANFAQAYDADTGLLLFNVTQLPNAVTSAMGPNGEIIRYVITNAGTTSEPNWRLMQWNSTNMWTGVGFKSLGSGFGITPAIDINPNTGTVNASSPARYDYDIPITWRSTMTQTTVVAAWPEDVMLCYNGTLPSMTSWTPFTYFAVNLNSSKGTVGSILWQNTIQPPSGNITVVQSGADPIGRVFLEGYKETMQWNAYNLDTGKKMWGPTDSQAALDYYGIPGIEDRVCSIAYGKVYSSEFSGIVYCYDEFTGDLLWTYGNGGEGNSTNSGFAVPGNYPMAINAIGNGVIYTVTTEHTVNTPIYKGATVRAINATDGSELWQLSAYTGEFHSYSYAIADGYCNYFNGYDNQIYTLGRGPSALTVDAPLANVALGSGLVIKGTVTDISAGTQQDEQAARFPHGVPVVSDESMTDWMSYIYQQKPLPTNFTGVDVVIDVIDANGNYRNIGTAKTDASGTYLLPWTPDIEGAYTVIASFQGTNGYWPAYAETGFAVDPAAPTQPPATQAPANAADMYLLPGIAAIIVVIAIGFVVTILVLRKK
ncbi:MAG: PQQ-binding-like beta-propeller repeat protein [Candidatus Bathyarchaeota archaeon]|nr:PQQ-binding-like beta-propeller repeat protein [Candidatus Bathyarchaeota archaeon]